MTNERGRVGLLFGGRSGEHEVSIQSAASIFDALDPARWQTVPIGVDRDGRWRLGRSRDLFIDPDDVTRARIGDGPWVVPLPGERPISLVDARSGERLSAVDVFFPILHGTYGEDGSIQGLLRMLGAPFVGPDVAASAVAMDKDLAKRLLVDAGLPVARWTTIAGEEPPAGAPTETFGRIAREFGSVLFVKPANLGSSVGIRRVDRAEAFAEALAEALRFDRRVVVEEAIEGREIECAVIGNERPSVSVPGEVVPRGDFYDYEAKYVEADGAELRAPAPLDAATADRARSLAVDAYRALGCEGLARVDLFLRPDGTFLVNEINTLPGFTRISMFPRLWELSGLPYPRLLDRLIELALERHRRDASLEHRRLGG